MTPTPPDDLPAQVRQCATDLGSKSALTFAAALGRAPGLMAGAADEVERLRAAIDRHVADTIRQTPAGEWRAHAPLFPSYHPTRAEAEAAYRRQAFPGLDGDMKGA